MQSLRALSRSRSSIFHITSNQPWLSLITVSQQSHTCKANRWQHHLALDPCPSETVKLQKLDGCDHGIVKISLDRPKNKNAIDTNLMRSLKHVLELINQDSTANVAIFTSSVAGAFCAGADLKERKTFSSTQVREYSKALRATFTYIEELPIPTVAAIEGAALGGGLELALACDIRICGENAILGLPETGHAIIPGYTIASRLENRFGALNPQLLVLITSNGNPGLYRAGGTRRLPRLVSKAIAKDLIITGRRILGKDAESMGLANYSVLAGDAYSKALEIARNINEKGPIAIRAAKRAVEEGLLIVDREPAADLEEECYEMTLNTKDRLEALAAFVEKRKPKYRGE